MIKVTWELDQRSEKERLESGSQLQQKCIYFIFSHNLICFHVLTTAMKTCFPNHFFLKYELHVYTNRQGSEYFSQNVINVLRDVCCFCMAANQF